MWYLKSNMIRYILPGILPAIVGSGLPLIPISMIPVNILYPYILPQIIDGVFSREGLIRILNEGFDLESLHSRKYHAM